MKGEGGRCKKIMEVVEMMARNVMHKTVGVLSERYGFDREEAERELDKMIIEVKKIETKEKRKTSIILPFCGEINEECCSGIRLNHGLYTQCTNEKVKSIDGHMVCSTCEKQIEKNSNRMPTYGYIEDRIRKGKDFRDPKGKAPLNYGNIMENGRSLLLFERISVVFILRRLSIWAVLD